MLGKEILVAPVLDRTMARYVYLPTGRWTDYWSQAEFRGGMNLLCRTPLDRVPLFIRAGAIIPMGPEMQYVGEKEFDPLTLDIYVNKSEGAFMLYENTQQAIPIRFRVFRKNIFLSLGISDKRFIAKFHHMDPPKAITVERRNSRGASLERHSVVWEYLSEERVLRVRLPRRTELVKITL